MKTDVKLTDMSREERTPIMHLELEDLMRLPEPLEGRDPPAPRGPGRAGSRPGHDGAWPSSSPAARPGRFRNLKFSILIPQFSISLLSVPGLRVDRHSLLTLSPWERVARPDEPGRAG